MPILDNEQIEYLQKNGYFSYIEEEITLYKLGLITNEQFGSAILQAATKIKEIKINKEEKEKINTPSEIIKRFHF